MFFTKGHRLFEPGRDWCLDCLRSHLYRTVVRLAVIVIVACGVGSDAAAQQAPTLTSAPEETDQHPGESESSVQGHDRRMQIELKRQNTDRGTPEESTKTTVRIEGIFKGSVALLRLDLPFPDEKTSFEGQLFNPRLGDIKTRIGFRPLQAYGFSFPSFLEVTFPTADPDSLGSGKYQLSVGVRMLAPVSLPILDRASHTSRFDVEVQQVNSIGGDSSRKDINYTKFEFTLYDIWRRKYTMKLKLKPTVDWTQNGTIGAVFEVEGGLLFARDWRTWLMLGHRLWGPSGIPNTYEKRLEIGVARTF